MKIKMNLKNNYKLVPEGERRLKITKSECSPSGKPSRWNLTFEDSEGGFVNTRFDFTNDKSLFAMGKFLESVLGFKDGDEFDTKADAERCLGIDIIAEVVHTEGSKVNDDGEPTIFANVVNKTIRLADNTTTQTATESPRNMISNALDDLD